MYRQLISEFSSTFRENNTITANVLNLPQWVPVVLPNKLDHSIVSTRKRDAQAIVSVVIS